MPRPSSPTSQPCEPQNSISVPAFERSPIFSLKRWMRSSLSRPSGVQRGTKKQDRPLGDCAVTRKASHIGAERNHLWPVRRQLPSGIGSARVVLARTSEPPCFSVRPMPISTPFFCAAGMKRLS
jgi:hypothetical protein